MCGRYVMKTSRVDLLKEFPDVDFPEFDARVEIRPTNQVLVATQLPGRAEMMRWGLLPPWAEDVKSKLQPINAMSETAHEKPMFKRLLGQKRCIFFASGFYEWKPVPGQKKKQRHLITVGDGQPIAFAGLWDVWHAKEEAVRSCTILTTSANELVKTIHNRMPVILDRAGVQKWLEPNATIDELRTLLQPRVADGMVAGPVEEPVQPKGEKSEEPEPEAEA